MSLLYFHAQNHRPAQKEKLNWVDIEHGFLMLMRRGLSSTVDTLRDEIGVLHPHIKVIDVPRCYSLEVFNECIQHNCLMGSLDVSSDIHPSIATISMD